MRSVNGEPPDRADVIVLRNGEVFINGTKIGNVKNIETTHEATFGPWPTVQIEFTPTSFIYGQPPKETLEDAVDDGGTVDISRAIERASERVRRMP